jgi:hypothetical protein
LEKSDLTFFGDIYIYHQNTIMEKKCERCGINFNGKKNQKFCSKKCIHQKIEKTIKICELNGCDNTFLIYPNTKTPKRLCSRKCQIEWQKINMVGEKNPNYGNRKPNMFKHSEESKNLIKQKIKESWKKESRLKKHLDFFERHRLPDGSMDWHTEEFREKISKANIIRLENNETNFSYKNCIKGFLLNIKTNESEYYHSSWEMNKMIELNENNNVIFWTKKHGIHIKYYYKNFNKLYLPDFYVEYKNGVKKIEEIKGYIEDEEQLKIKIIACKEYCKNNNLEYTIDYVENKEKYKHLIEWEKKLN